VDGGIGGKIIGREFGYRKRGAMEEKVMRSRLLKLGWSGKRIERKVGIGRDLNKARRVRIFVWSGDQRWGEANYRG